MILTLIEAALRSLLVAATVWAGLRVLRVNNVFAQKAAWSLVLFSAMAMPVAMRWQALAPGMTVVLPAQLWGQALAGPVNTTSSAPASEQPTPAATQTDANPPGNFSSAQMTMQTFPISRESAPANTVQTPPVARTKETSPRWSLHQPATLAALLYVAVCTCLLLRLTIGFGAAVRFWFKAEPVEPDMLPDAFNGYAQGSRLRSSRTICSPVTIGSGILLPADFIAWDAEKLRIVLAHESSHVRQGDFFLQLLAELYTAVFWFSPLGWWLKGKLCDLSETISDHAGLGAAASGPSYAQVLLEFAATPRLTMRGVAMARPNNLSRRIERLLNESSFRQAFASGGRRALLAVLLVPVALFAASTLIRVEAKGQSAPLPAVAPQPTLAVPPQASNSAIEAPIAPLPPINPAAPVPPSAPGTAVIPEGAPALPPLPEIPAAPFAPNAPHVTLAAGQSEGPGQGEGKHYSFNYSYNYSYSDNGDSFALVSGSGEHSHISGDWNEKLTAEIDKARHKASSDFLWFSHGGKSYVIADPAIVSQIKDMYKPIEELGKKQRELGKQQREFSRQERELGHEMKSVSFTTPDLSKEIAAVEKEMEKLKAMQGKSMTSEEWTEVQRKLGKLEGKLGAIQGQIGTKEGSFGGEMGKLGEMQGKLGEEQGRLGAEQGKLSQEANRQVESIIDQSLKDGKARPVE